MPVRTLAEEEERLKEGTLKWVVFQVLKKAAGAAEPTAEGGTGADASGTEEGAASPGAQQQRQQQQQGQQQQGQQQQGLTVDEIIQAATAQGLKSDWTEKAHRNMASVSGLHAVLGAFGRPANMFGHQAGAALQ